MTTRLSLRSPCAFGAVAVALLVAISCSRSSGTGEVTGKLYVKGCDGEDLGTLEAPGDYDLDPRFIAGEPIEDLRVGGVTENRLIIRLQSSGKKIEVNDTLTFYVTNSYAVATCVRGRKVASPSGEQRPEYDPRHCSWGPDGKGPPRLRVGPDFPIRASLAPRDRCTKNQHVVGTAVGTAPSLPAAGEAPKPPVPPESWESWIELQHFGSATERDDISKGFRVVFGERLHASAFHLTLTDDLEIKAKKRNEPAPELEILGTLEGRFDFDLIRGQGFQAFP
jgi:hypothetical protein